MSQTEKDRFLAVFPKIQAELLDFLEANFMPEDAKAWFKKNLEYNVPGGKLNRGMSVVDTVEILRGERLSEEEYFEVALLGWGVELLQAFFLVSDDMMDGSITRRGQPCWYLVEEPFKVGSVAINDSFMLESSIYYLLKRHFKGRPYYGDLVDIFHEMAFMTELGQLVDLITAPEDSVDLSKFSLLKHRLIVVYKTSYYSFYLPIAIAMMYIGVPVPPTMPTLSRTLVMTSEPRTSVIIGASVDGGAKSVNGGADPYQLALDILLPLGEYFQVQDDCLDCFGKDIGKIGTDIMDNKCSWVICTALQLVNSQQRDILDANYGRKDSACESRCKAVFEELGLRKLYAEYEEDAYTRINTLIEKFPEESYGGPVTLKRDIFYSFLRKIYRRQK